MIVVSLRKRKSYYGGKKRKNLNYKEMLPIVLLLLNFVLALFYYPQLPAKMATHFDFSGNANDWSFRDIGAFAVPFAALFIYLVLHFLPSIDTKEQNISKVSSYLFAMKSTILSLLLVVQLYILSFNLPSHLLEFNFTLVSDLLISLLILNFAVLSANVKRNYFIGFRTPYSLADDKIWDLTNKLGADLLAVLSAILFISSFLLPGYFIYALILGVVIVAFAAFFYSLLLYKRLIEPLL